MLDFLEHNLLCGKRSFTVSIRPGIILSLASPDTLQSVSMYCTVSQGVGVSWLNMGNTGHSWQWGLTSPPLSRTGGQISDSLLAPLKKGTIPNVNLFMKNLHPVSKEECVPELSACSLTMIKILF